MSCRVLLVLSVRELVETQIRSFLQQLLTADSSIQEFLVITSNVTQTLYRVPPRDPTQRRVPYTSMLHPRVKAMIELTPDRVPIPAPLCLRD